MTVTSEVTKLNTNLTNAYTAVDGKGGTLPQAQNFDNLATAISSIPSSGGSGKYQLLQRISDDNGNEIGTVSGFFTDANDVEYAVVCLDAIYRNTSAQWASETGQEPVINMPEYETWALWETHETATENTTLILASFPSSACSHCRQYSFVIDRMTYYGQLPNIIELTDIAKHRTAINTADTSGGSIMIATDNQYWSSNQYALGAGGWLMWSDGSVAAAYNEENNYVCPVLEMPNTL